MTLDGIALGAGAGMYGCRSPLEEDTGGALRGGADGVKIPLDSPMNCGLSSQLDAVGLGVSWKAVIFLSGVTSGGNIIFSELESARTIGGLTLGDCDFGSILGGGILDSRLNGVSSPIGADGLVFIAGTASNGVRKAFSQEPGRGSFV